MERTYSFILLVKVVNVLVQDLDKELNRDRCIHAGIGNAKGTLETFEDALTVAVELERERKYQHACLIESKNLTVSSRVGTKDLPPCPPCPPPPPHQLPVPALPSPTKDGSPHTQHGTDPAF